MQCKSIFLLHQLEKLTIVNQITYRTNLSIDELCNEVKGFKRTEITETVYSIHREGLVEFDGNNIKYLKIENSPLIVGQGDSK